MARLGSLCTGELELTITEFRSISLDLIFAVPGQTLADFDADLDRVLDAPPDHVSVYGLTIEPGTPFARAIDAAVDKVLAASPTQIANYKAGQEKLFGYFVGQVMKEMKGKGNPALVNAALKQKLG